MAMRFVVKICTLFLLFNCVVVEVNCIHQPPKFFDVVKYGAVGDGKTDDTQAFVKAWEDACAYGGRGRVWIPRRIFSLSSHTFTGPCNGSMAFLIKGTLQARTDIQNLFTNTWIGFRYVENLQVKGGGVLDGQGRSAWRYNDCQTNNDCKPLPVTLRFDFVKNSRVRNLRSINPKNSHINLFACQNMSISYVRLNAPATSPNTDGIHIGLCNKIKIAHSIIGTGDDCISMVSGSQNIDIHDVACGPGHGISIGSLGRTRDEFVSGITVRNCTFKGTDNGARIKTWSPSLHSEASDILFEDIVMEYAQNPIVIDQNYCISEGCSSFRGESRSSVQIQGVTFKNIRGVSSSKVAVSMQCSGAMPCRNVQLIDIDLAYDGPGGEATALCSNVVGSSQGKLVPSGCL